MSTGNIQIVSRACSEHLQLQVYLYNIIEVVVLRTGPNKEDTYGVNHVINDFFPCRERVR